MDLTLAPNILEQVIQHAKSALSQRSLRLARRSKRGRTLHPNDEYFWSAQEYEIDPAELIQALRHLRDSGESLIAIFHSHPHGPAEPSNTDIRRAYYPEAAHLIVSLAELERPQAAAFRIIDGVALAVELRAIV